MIVQTITTYDYYKKTKKAEFSTEINKESHDKEKQLTNEETLEKDKTLEKKEVKEKCPSTNLTRKETIQLLKKTKDEFFGKGTEEKAKVNTKKSDH